MRTVASVGGFSGLQHVGFSLVARLTKICVSHHLRINWMRYGGGEHHDGAAFWARRGRVVSIRLDHAGLQKIRQCVKDCPAALN